MKHAFGYGILVVALVVVLVWGYKHVQPAPGTGATPKLLQGGHNHNSDFEIDLMEKSHKKKKPTDADVPQVTDHPADYAAPDTSSEALKTFTWVYSKKFEIWFDPQHIPCKPQDMTGPGKNELMAAKNGNNWTATCNLSDAALQPPPVPAAPSAPGATGVPLYYYWVYLNDDTVTGVQPKAILTGPQTCDGCFLEID